MDMEHGGHGTSQHHKPEKEMPCLLSKRRLWSSVCQASRFVFNFLEAFGLLLCCYYPYYGCCS